MQKILVMLIGLVVSSPMILAQNETMYIYKGGQRVGQYKIDEIDSIIFYNASNVGEAITDVDGHIYKTVTIGAQTWTSENMKTIRYRNGDLISGWYSYDNKDSVVKIYGLLYSWNVVSDPRGVCPVGWHVPSNDEWTVLINYLGGAAEAGGYLKETGTNYWEAPNYTKNNDYDFALLPAGARGNYSGEFVLLGKETFLWSSTEHDTYSAKMIKVSGNSLTAEQASTNKNEALSVRCLKD